MAALASTAVSFYPGDKGRRNVGTGGTREVVESRLALVLTGQGTAANEISASALGFHRLISCSNLYDATNNKIYLAMVDPVNNRILLAATAADTPTDVTSVASYITVTGAPN